MSSAIHLAYNLFANLCACALIPSLWLRYALLGRRRSWLYQRLGVYPKPLRYDFRNNFDVWLHAVSVGEVNVAAAIIRALKQMLPECRIALSTSTEQGQKHAVDTAGQWAVCFYAPFDLNLSTKRALQLVRPRVLGLLETELWPNMIVNAHKMGVRTVLLNGRISARTISGYHKIRPLLRYTLDHLDALSMISEADMKRIGSLGASAHRMCVNGNAKFDCLIRADTDDINHVKALYHIDETTPVFVAGSTRHFEEEFVIDAFLSIRRIFPKTLLILAPRHIQRTRIIEQHLREKGLNYQLRTGLARSSSKYSSSKRPGPVVVLDTIGELAKTYGAADFVFCGGSLVPKGGQNVLEPAWLAKPVMFGPSMEDFQEARDLIEKAGGGVMVNNARDMADTAIHWLKFPEKAALAGQAARDAVYLHQGAAKKHALMVCRLLQD
ncbi:MAG: hypothetical protein GY874_23210 [Desulfobacteraceae bacterium]|nr:hypothetical protein [Desulfobacteraceae bacterium]